MMTPNDIIDVLVVYALKGVSYAEPRTTHPDVKDLGNRLKEMIDAR